MALNVTTAMLAIQTVQSVFSDFESTVKFGSFMCPMDTPIDQIMSSTYNFIIVGSGTAGSVLMSRLTECPLASVLVLEAGGCPPLESFFLKYFLTLPRTKYDYDMYSENDHYALQNLQGGKAGLTAGKMLGGTSSIQHMLVVRGSIPDFDPWAKAANDSSWNYDGLLPYFIKSENVIDKPIVKKYRKYHGTKGPVIMQRQRSPENANLFKSFEELDYEVRIDTNNDQPLGVTEPMFQLDDKYRQGGLQTRIYPAKDRPNLHILTGATVTKIIFNDKKAAIGVQLSYKGRSYVVKCIDEVIVSAGAIKTPQLLMLSGVGPAKHLRSKNISVIADLPVGENFQDHVSAAMLFGLENDTSPTPDTDPTKFPTPITCNYVNLDNPCANFTQFQGINLLFPHDNQGLMDLCRNALKYTEPICQKWADANVGRRILFSLQGFLRPASKGKILLKTTNIDDPPQVFAGYLSNRTDLVNLGKFLAHTIKLLGTTYFKKIGAEFIDLGVCPKHKKFSVDYWECYALAMSSTLWHYCGTAALGSVVDTNLYVKEVKGLRVVDASIIPVIPGGKINAVVIAIAEKIANVIRATYKHCCSRKRNQG